MMPVVQAWDGITLESFNGTIASEGARDGRPLILGSLDEGQARACVYFTTDSPLVVG
jgi:hypothetical protein